MVHEKYSSQRFGDRQPDLGTQVPRAGSDDRNHVTVSDVVQEMIIALLFFAAAFALGLLQEYARDRLEHDSSMMIVNWTILLLKLKLLMRLTAELFEVVASLQLAADRMINDVKDGSQWRLHHSITFRSGRRGAIDDPSRTAQQDDLESAIDEPGEDLEALVDRDRMARITPLLLFRPVQNNLSARPVRSVPTSLGARRWRG